MQENVPAQLDTLGGKPEPKAADEHGVLNSQMSRISFTMNALTGKNCDLRSQNGRTPNNGILQTFPMIQQVGPSTLLWFIHAQKGRNTA